MKTSKFRKNVFQLILTSLVQFFSTFLFSQQNQPYKEEYIYFFTRPSNSQVAEIMKSIPSELVAINIKKMEDNNGCKSYFFNRTVNTKFWNNSGCIKRDLASNLGGSIHFMTDGKFFILNQFNDTILFRTKDSVGSSWNNIINNERYPEIKKINIRIKSIKTDSVLGELDTVIAYEYLPYDKENKLLKNEHVYMCESKFALNHGFIESIDLCAFPFINFQKLSIKLCGRMKNDYTERIGLTGIWRFQVDDINVGDEAQSMYSNFWPNVWHLNNPKRTIAVMEYFNKYLISKTIGREENDSQIILTLYDEIWEYGRKDSVIDDIVFTFSKHDTLKKITHNKIIRKSYDANNHVPLVDPTYDIGVNYFSDIDVYHRSYLEDENKDYNLIQSHLDSCWFQRVGDPPTRPGIIYYSGVADLSRTVGHFDKNYLTYFKKGNIERGTPYPFALGTKTLENKGSQYVVFPNPTNHEFAISNHGLKSEKLNIKIVNHLGSTVFLVQTKTNEIIDISSLDAGVYFVEIVANDQKFVKKIVKN